MLSVKFFFTLIRAPAKPLRAMKFNKDKLENYRKQLNLRRIELSQDVQKVTTAMIEEDPMQADSLDQAAADTDRGIAVQIQNHGRDVLAQIDAALRRIDAGTFGQCASCGDAIGEARMKANPSTTLCIDCQAELEFEQRGRNTRRA